MSRFYDLVTEHVRTLGRGAPGKPKRYAERDGALNCIRMASNENPFGPSPLAIEAMQAVAEESNFYPDNNVAELRRKIAERHLLAIESVLVTAGSTSLLGIIARTLLSPGRNAVSSERSFIVYSIATKAAGGRLIEVPMRHDGFDLDAIADAIDQNTRIIFVANPNNPTGTIVGPDALDRFLTRIPDHVIGCIGRGLLRLCTILCCGSRRGIFARTRICPPRPQCSGLAYLLESTWLGGSAGRVRVGSSRTDGIFQAYADHVLGVGNGAGSSVGRP